MELFRTTTLILIIASVQHMTEAAIEPRKMLQIPEKIISGMMGIVQSHKNKQSQVVEQSQVQTYQGYSQQYAPWNSAYPTTAYNQNQFQNQGQYANYATYPTTSGQMYPSQQGYTGSQVQTQSQYQTYPQNQSGNQFQAQNQQNFNAHIQQPPLQQQSFLAQQVQGQNHIGVNLVQGQNQQSGQLGVNQGQIQGQNQQSGQFVLNQGLLQNQGHFQNPGQIQTGQFAGLNTQTAQAGSLVNENQSGQYGQFSQQNAQFQGQGHGSNGQSGGFQVSSPQHAGSGPTCLCQAWTKPQMKGSDGKGKSDGTTKIPE